MTAYGSLLRRLLEFTGTKLYAAAEEVGYDVSYVSKWCSRDLLPAPKTAHGVNTALGRYLAAAIERDGQEADFVAAFPQAPAGLPLERRITALLSEAYEASAHRREAPCPAGELTLLTQRHEMLGKLRDLPLPGSGPEGAVVCTIDLLTLLESRDLTVLDHLFQEGEVHLHAALDLERFQRDPDRSVRLLYRFLSRHRETFVTLYDGAGLEREGLLAIRNGTAMMAGLDRRWELDTLLAAEGTAGARLLETAWPRLRERPVLLAPARPEDMSRNGYRTDFYSRDQFQFFSCFGFEFLLPEAACGWLAHAGAAGGPEADHTRDIRRLFITWEEVFQKSHIDFYLLKSSLLRYLDTGELLFADIPYHMSYAQRLEHLENIKELVLANHDIHFLILDDDTLPPGPSPSLAVYLSPKKLFLKNPGAYLSGVGPMFYTVQSDPLIQAARRYLERLQSLDACQRFDYRDVPELERRYGGMIYRMLTMHQSGGADTQSSSPGHEAR